MRTLTTLQMSTQVMLQCVCLTLCQNREYERFTDACKLLPECLDKPGYDRTSPIYLKPIYQRKTLKFNSISLTHKKANEQRVKGNGRIHQKWKLASFTHSHIIINPYYLFSKRCQTAIFYTIKVKGHQTTASTAVNMTLYSKLFMWHITNNYQTHENKLCLVSLTLNLVWYIMRD